MLNALEIFNYQAHKSSYLEFHPGMNVITGISNAGKTAILRDMVWGLFNRPSGGDFKGWYCQDSDIVETSFEFDNGWFTKRRAGDKRIISKDAKGKEVRRWEGGKNQYESEGGKYDALRSDVPIQIQEISNMTENNVQMQHEKYYMLQDSPGDRAKKLNELVGLDIVDTVFKKINAKISTCKQDIVKQTTEIAAYEIQLEEMKFLDAAEEIITSLSNDIDEYTKLAGKAKSLSESISKLREYDAQIADEREFLKIEPEYLKLTALIDCQKVLQSNQSGLSDIITSIKTINATIKEDTEWLAVEAPYLELMSLFVKKDSLSIKIQNLNSSISAIKNFNCRIEEDIKVTIDLAKEYTDLLNKVGECPTCCHKINPAEIDSIRKSLLGD